jgi:hypothetical protein
MADAIIKVDGTILYGKITEVNPAEVKYRMVNIRDGAVITLPREQVYAISYSNNTTQVITPGFGTGGTAAKAVTSTSAVEKTDSVPKIKPQPGNGSLKIGMGYSQEYSRYNGISDFTKTANVPSFYLSYHFVFNKWLKTGFNAGYSSFDYEHEFVSDYDGIAISQMISESVFTVGAFGRYDLLNGALKPYLLLGLNVNYSIADMDGDIYSTDTGKHVLTTTNLRGFKTNFVARAGLDLMITRRLGLFTDIGTGTTLLQSGIVFSFK